MALKRIVSQTHRLLFLTLAKQKVTRLSRSFSPVSRLVKGLGVPLALVQIELRVKAFLSIFGAGERSHGNFELLTTICAHPDDEGELSHFTTRRVGFTMHCSTDH